MANIPTAEEVLKMIEISVSQQSKVEVIQAYARSYVKAALEAAHDKGRIELTRRNAFLSPRAYIDKDSILNAYPLNLIK